MWDWSTIQGDPACIKWGRRDLETLERVLQIVPGRTAAIQAGGNIGLFPRRLAEVFGTVYTFEPSAHLFAQMMANAPATNIVRFQAAVGDERRLVGLSRARRDGSGRAEHDGLTHVVEGGTTPTLRIDDLALPVCDLIYLDIEGFELYAIRGAQETITRCRPVIAVEVNRGIGYYGHSQDELRQTIKDHGYRHVMSMHSDEVYVYAG